MIAERTQQTQGKGGQRQAGVLRNRMDERDHYRAGNCKMCNSKTPESDRSNYRRLGWDGHLISPCLKFAMNASTGLVL